MKMKVMKKKSENIVMAYQQASAALIEAKNERRNEIMAMASAVMASK
jgi:PleD family two-component response regulator